MINRLIAKASPASYAVLEKLNVPGSCAALHSCVRAFATGRAAGIWAMYEKESKLCEELVGATLQSAVEQWSLVAMRLADQPSELDHF